MIRRLPWCFVVCLLILSGCGTKKEKSQEPKVENSPSIKDVPTPQNTKVLETGMIGGKVILDTLPTPNPLIRMTADPVCVQMTQNKKVFQEMVIRDDEGGLKNVFVYIKTGPALQKTYPPPSNPVILDQEGCVYHPRVFGIQVGQLLRARNNDATLHNVHAFSETGNGFNTAQPVQGMVSEFPMKAEEVMIRFRCDVHPWMIAFAGVLPHPFFSVTDEHGHFVIPEIPPGQYEIATWHEVYGTLTNQVQVFAGKTTEVTLKYSSRPSSNAGFLPTVRELTISTLPIRFVNF